MPSRRGRAVLLAAFACWMAALVTHLGELATLAVAGTVFPLVAVAVVRRRRHRISAEQHLSPARLFAGGSLRIRIDVRNAGRLASPPLLVEDRAPAALGGPIRFVVASLPPGRRETLQTERRAAVRGRYAVGPLRLLVTDPFGLAEAGLDVGTRLSVTVYPRVEVLDRTASPRVSGRAGSAAQPGVAPGGDEFFALREWTEGDDLRKIHWHSVARTGRLMIRQDEASLLPRATVLLDRRDHRGAGAGSSLEWAVSAAASSLCHLAGDGFAFRLAGLGREPIRPTFGRQALDPLLGALATCEPSADGSMLPLIRRLASDAQGGAFVAILPPPPAVETVALARLRRVFGWCGAVLVDTWSFDLTAPEERARADQRIAAAERALIQAGWRVAVAGASDRFPETWRTLFAARSLRPSLPSARS